MAKLQLLGGTNSPYARKVILFAIELGVREDIDFVLQDVSPIKETNATVAAANPLGKVPALLRPDAPPVYDSAVIVQYLDSLVSPEKRILPAVDDPKRYETLTIEALCDGISDAAILARYETYRPLEHQKQPFLTGQRSKMERGIKHLFTLKLRSTESPLSYEAICTANILWYLSHRFSDWKWWEFENGGKELKAWYDELIAKRSTWGKTTEFL